MSAKGIILVALVAVALLSSVSEARKHAKLRIHQKNTAENEAIKPHASQDETLSEQKMDLVVDDHKVGEVKELQTGAMSCANITCQNGGYCLETGSGEPHCLCFRFYTGQYCQLTSAVNVALSDRSTTCTASSSPDDCYNVIDGILLGDDWFVDAGDIWIELDFGEFRYMVALQIRQRCNQNNQNRGVTLTYSDGFQQSIELACHNSGFNDTVCENTYWQHFDLELRMTRSLRFTVDTVCNQTAINRANGFKEIKVYAYEVGVTNIALESYGSTCTASSEYNNLEFNCEQAMDGVIEPGPGNEWASNNEGAGAWIEMSFPGNFGIYSIGLLPRCAAAAQILQVTATFSTGRELVFDLVCNGGGNPYDCDGQDFQRFMLATPEDSNNLRLTITTICEGIEADHGFREIEVLAIKLSSASELSAIELDSRLACSNITCENGGTCVVTSGGFPQCVCSRFYTGTYCQTSALLDVARSVLAATCIASSQPGSCTNALDSFPGGEGWYTNLGEVNSWIEIDFGEFYYIIALQIRQLCNGDDQISAISVRFSDFEQTIQVACHNISTGDSECENTYWQNFDLETRMSRSLRIDVIEVCRGNNYIGLREIKVFGYDTALINIAALSYGSNCTASSQYNPDELNCQAALDGKTDPADPPSEWASNGEGAGAWIQVNFPGQFKIYQIGLLPRCKADIQQVTALFDKDRTEVFNLTCNGGQHMYDCDGQEFQQFPLASPLESTFVRLTISSICDVQANHGFREIHVYGMKSVTIAADAEVRLVDGDDQYEGRVEFIYEGVWGTVCDDSWDSLDAQVVCRELGYSGGQPFGSAYFGQGSGPIWLDDVNCAGTEERLSECPNRGIGSHNCGHYEDAGVRCQP